MSIYNKPIADVNTADLQELLAENAVENYRLEFKRQDPNRDQMLKKLSSMANTHGGYLLVGANAGSDGRLIDFTGVNIINGYKQRLIQWCFDNIYPPMEPVVSDPIPSPTHQGQYVYVIYVEESENTPHFISSRRGIWVRTDEFSQRFEPKLATYDEILQLSHRRKHVEDRRKRLIDRFESRLKNFRRDRERGPYDDAAESGAYSSLIVAPKFPTRKLCQSSEIERNLNAIRLPWRQSRFHRAGTPIVSQQESICVFEPGSSHSYLEMNQWGMTCYALEMERTFGETVGIHVNQFLGHLLAYLEHQKRFFSHIGYEGALFVRIGLHGVRNVPWMFFVSNIPQTVGGSVLDDEVLIDLEVTTREMVDDRDMVASKILKEVFFATNLRAVIEDEETIQRLLRQGYEYNVWQWGELLG